MSIDSSSSNPQPGHPFGVPSGDSMQTPKKSNTALILIVCAAIGITMLMCGGVLVALLLPAVGAARDAAMKMQRMNNVKQVGLALHNYHSAYRQLPYTAVAAPSGRVTLGWRLSIAPFVEGQSQWEQFNQDEAWDSRENSMLAEHPPFPFQTIKGNPGDTNIFAVVADEGMFPATPMKQVKFGDVADGLASTLMLIELPNRTMNWMSPDNFTPDEAFAAIGELNGTEVAHLLTGDGAVHAVTRDLDRDLFDALITRDGGESTSMGF